MHSAFLKCASLEFSLKVKHSLDAHLKISYALLDLGTLRCMISQSLLQNLTY